MAKSAAFSTSPTIQTRCGPYRSVSPPSGTVPSSDTPAAMDSPSPTWAALSPSARVKKTALPAWNRPLPTA